jgi:hypothetical protein
MHELTHPIKEPRPMAPRRGTAFFCGCRPPRGGRRPGCLSALPCHPDPSRVAWSIRANAPRVSIISGQPPETLKT